MDGALTLVSRTGLHKHLMPARPETALDMGRRHVREGEERLARQANIVGKMEAHGHDEQAALGRRLFETMRLALNLQRRHLRDMEARAQRERDNA